MRPIHQDKTYPICEGSNVIPLVESVFGVTDTWGSRAPCPGCGHTFRINRDGRLRQHRRLP
jgi:hypothetical protein